MVETDKQLSVNVEDENNLEASEVNVEDVSEPSNDKLEDEDKLEIFLINTVRNIEERLESKINSLVTNYMSLNLISEK